MDFVSVDLLLLIDFADDRQHCPVDSGPRVKIHLLKNGKSYSRCNQKPVKRPSQASNQAGCFVFFLLWLLMP